MNAPFFDEDRMLSLANFKWSMFGSMSAYMFVCTRCLPIVVSHGIDFKNQCGDDMLFGHVFLDNTDLHKTGMPTQHHAKCANCNRRRTCWKLELRLGAYEYVHDHEMGVKMFDDWDAEVMIMGKCGRVVRQLGHDTMRPWISIYTIKFEDGTTFDAYRWQFKVVSKQRTS